MIKEFGFPSDDQRYTYAKNLLNGFKKNTEEAINKKFSTEEERAAAQISLEICTEMMWNFMKHHIDHGGSY